MAVQIRQATQSRIEVSATLSDPELSCSEIANFVLRTERNRHRRALNLPFIRIRRGHVKKPVLNVSPREANATSIFGVGCSLVHDVKREFFLISDRHPEGRARIMLLVYDGFTAQRAVEELRLLHRFRANLRPNF